METPGRRNTCRTVYPVWDKELRSKSVKQLPWKSVEETKSREFLVCSPVLRPSKDVYVFRVWRRTRVLVACLAENDKMGS